MLRDEWKNLWKHKFLIIILIAIITIPSLYTVIFLGSMWDPYGNIENLPVAVVNLDQEVEYEDTTYNLGQELVDNLKENYYMDFNFVDAETAEAGLTNGTYYMIITIPEDFSQSATTVTDDNPEKLELDYEVSPGTNYIASKMSESALVKIRESISNKVTESYTKAIYAKISELGEGMETASDGAEDLDDGVAAAVDGNEEITENLTALSEGTLTLSDGTEELENGIVSYTEGVAKVNDGMSSLSDGIDTLADSSETLSSGVTSLYDGSSELLEGTSTYTTGVDDLYEGTTTLVGNDSTILDGMQSVSEGTTSLKSGSSTLLSGLQTLSDTLGTQVTDENYAQLVQLETGLNSINTNLQDLNTLVTEGDLSDPTTQAQVIAIVNALSESSNTALPTASASMEQLYQGLNSVQTALTQEGTTADTMGVLQGMSSLNDGIIALDQGINGNEANGIVGLNSGISSYISGVETVNAGLATLSGSSETLVSGAEQLNSGLLTMSDSMPTLLSGIQDLSDGATTLSDGTAALVSNNSDLVNGASEVADATVDVADGAALLADGSVALGDGLTEISDGTGTLAEKLSDGADEIEDSEASDDTVSMISDPVETNESYDTDLDNNGSAMAAYMMSVGLWIACLALCMLYPVDKFFGTLKGGLYWWISKTSVLSVIAIIQSIIMVIALKAAYGFSPISTGKTIMIACLASLAFMSIVLFFNICFGKVGSYLLLIFMLLQLSACAGTYPLELSGEFYNFIHKFMPFSYSVSGFRKTIATGLSIRSEIGVFVGIIIVFSVLSVAVYEIKGKKIFNKNIKKKSKKICMAD